MKAKQAETKFRAQVRGLHGNWVDGGLFGSRKNAEKDAQKLSEQYGQPVRVIEVR